ncbi:MAG: L-rhamnose mutarotase [Cyclobacteriaceae bacterium]
MKTFCLTLDLKNDPDLIEAYIRHHENVWPEVKESIYSSGITGMKIYHVADRLVMIMETGDDFSFEAKAKADLGNPKVQEWEALMDQYQSRLPFAPEGVKWVLLDKIFELK